MISPRYLLLVLAAFLLQWLFLHSRKTIVRLIPVILYVIGMAVLAGYLVLNLDMVIQSVLPMDAPSVLEGEFGNNGYGASEIPIRSYITGYFSILLICPLAFSPITIGLGLAWLVFAVRSISRRRKQQ